jgi:hypothetical protein
LRPAPAPKLRVDPEDSSPVEPPDAPDAPEGSDLY